MQRKSGMLLLFLPSMLFGSDSSHATLSDFSACIHRRYYYIERLKKTMQLLSQVKKQLHQVNFLIRRMTRRLHFRYNFKHPRIKDNVREIIRTRSLKPLFKVWDEFIVYKSLESDLFIDEFTQEIFIVTKSLLLQHIVEKKAFCSDIFACEIRLTMAVDIESRLEQISAMTDQLAGLDQMLHIQTWFNRTDDVYDMMKSVSPEAVLQRFYHIRRLAEHQKLLLLPEFKTLLQLIDMRGHPPLVLPKISDAALQAALLDGLHEKNCQLLHKLLEDFEQFKALEDQNNVIELAKAIFCVYWHILLPVQARNVAYQLVDRDGFIEEIFAAYEQVEQLSLEDLLDSIDRASKVLKQVL